MWTQEHYPTFVPCVIINLEAKICELWASIFWDKKNKCKHKEREFKLEDFYIYTKANQLPQPAFYWHISLKWLSQMTNYEIFSPYENPNEFVMSRDCRFQLGAPGKIKQN